VNAPLRAASVAASPGLSVGGAHVCAPAGEGAVVGVEGGVDVAGVVGGAVGADAGVDGGLGYSCADMGGKGAREKIASTGRSK